MSTAITETIMGAKSIPRASRFVIDDLFAMGNLCQGFRRGVSFAGSPRLPMVSAWITQFKRTESVNHYRNTTGSSY
jgi:hypothetical protein